jgi:hypothetical protein
MFAGEKDLNCGSARIPGTEGPPSRWLSEAGARTFSGHPDAGEVRKTVRIACLAPSVALR